MAEPPATVTGSEAGEVSTTRMEAFSDGVVAIAATLLVIELKAPAPGEGLGHALREEGPSMAAFAVSFITILIFWVNHHALFATVHHVDRGLLFLNGLLLLAITFISYPTAVLGPALRDGTSAHAAALLYALVLAAAATLFTVLRIYLRARPRLLRPEARPRAATAVRRSLVGPFLYLLTAVVALVSAPAALAVAALVAVFFTLPPRGGKRPANAAPQT
jgi:TMEM175 potassium channel family protein